MNTLGIIPARGGSKGVPRKNVRYVCGKPLIGWTIEAALEADCVDRVMVSTDDPEIDEVSRDFGAETIQRPIEISGDRASSESALLHVLRQLQAEEDFTPQVTVFLQCTAPLMLPEDIDGTVQTLLNSEADTALAVTDFHYFLWERTTDGDARGINHDKSVRLLRQEQRPQFVETGAVYAMDTEGFLQHEHRFFGKTVLYRIPGERRWEIDEPVDMEIAEVMLRRREQEYALKQLPQEPAAVVLDFDGVFTDNRVVVTENGREAVACDRRDGHGLEMLRKAGVPVLVLSKEENPVVSARCGKLDLEVKQGIDDKLRVLRAWCTEESIDLASVVYVGNDVNDVECIQAAGCGVAVADAFPDVRRKAKLVLESEGGRGAVREVCQRVLNRFEGSSHE